MTALLFKPMFKPNDRVTFRPPTGMPPRRPGRFGYVRNVNGWHGDRVRYDVYHAQKHSIVNIPESQLVAAPEPAPLVICTTDRSSDPVDYLTWPHVSLMPGDPPLPADATTVQRAIWAASAFARYNHAVCPWEGRTYWVLIPDGTSYLVKRADPLGPFGTLVDPVPGGPRDLAPPAVPAAAG